MLVLKSHVVCSFADHFCVFDEPTLSLLSRLFFFFRPFAPLIPIGLASFASSSLLIFLWIMADWKWDSSHFSSQVPYNTSHAVRKIKAVYIFSLLFVIISENQKKLLTILADGEFHSGTELAKNLGVSRSAVWKQLHFLSEYGLEHHAISGKGYRLDKPLELLAHAQIDKAISEQTRAMISSLEIHDQIHSTNSYLAERSLENAPSGTVCLAEHQTAGKGRRGRHWISPYGNNIHLSILWRFQQGPAAISALSLAIGVAVIRALKQYRINDVGLKWPNDIYSQGKKLGGILIEVSGENEGPCAAVIGLGVNLFLTDNEAETIDQAWTDLSKIKGQYTLNRNYLAGLLLNHLFAVLDGYENTGIWTYLDEWRSYDCLKDQFASVYVGNQRYEGIVSGIDDSGLLLMKRPDGTTQAFASGELSFSRPIS